MDDGVGFLDWQHQKAEPHFVLVPLMAQGHMIPMADLALLLAGRGTRVSLVTTPVNAARLRSVADRAAATGLSLRLVQLTLPCAAAGLPEGCENIDLVPSVDLYAPFIRSLHLLAGPLKSYLREQPPAPTCIVADYCMPWTMEVARELGLPRFVFHGPSCFFLLCTLKLARHQLYEKVADDSESFSVPELPQRVEVTKRTAERFLDWPGTQDVLRHAQESEESADGVVLNTFYELERWFVEEYSRAVGKEVWTVGPVSLVHGDAVGKAMRGNAGAGEDHGGVMRWLEGREAGSVLFVSFGSVARTRPLQMVEIGLGLEAAGVPFVWAAKQAEQTEEAEAWMREFGERNGARGLVISGWVPQLLILTHPAVGGFMTHCGWNSALEGAAAGVPMVAWPHFSDQFLNAKLVAEVLRTGVGIEVERPDFYQSNLEAAAVVGRDAVERAVASVMGGDGAERRRRAKEVGEKARKAMEKGGSSHDSLTRLVGHAVRLAARRDAVRTTIV